MAKASIPGNIYVVWAETDRQTRCTHDMIFGNMWRAGRVARKRQLICLWLSAHHLFTICTSDNHSERVCRWIDSSLVTACRRLANELDVPHGN